MDRLATASTVVVVSLLLCACAPYHVRRDGVAESRQSVWSPWVPFAGYPLPAPTLDVSSALGIEEYAIYLEQKTLWDNYSRQVIRAIQVDRSTPDLPAPPVFEGPLGQPRGLSQTELARQRDFRELEASRVEAEAARLALEDHEGRVRADLSKCIEALGGANVEATATAVSEARLTSQEHLQVTAQPAGSLAAPELRLSDADQSYFPSGSAQLQPAAISALDELVLKHRMDHTTFRVEGHTDSDTYDNWKLSAERALAVIRQLLEQGVEPSRISGHFYSTTRPVANNGSDEGKASNRRVDIYVEGTDVGARQVDSLSPVKRSKP